MKVDLHIQDLCQVDAPQSVEERLLSIPTPGAI